MVRGLAIRAKVVQAHLHGHDGWVRRLDAYLKHPQTGRALEHTWQGCSVNGPERSFFFDGRLQPSHRRIMAALSWPVRLWSMVMTNAQRAYTIGAGVLTWVGRRYKIKASLVNRYTNHNKPGKRKITIWRWYSSSIGASPLPIWYCPEATPPWTLTPWQAASLDAVWQRCCHLRQGSLVPTRTLNWLQFRIYSNSVLTHSQCISMKNIDFPVLIYIYIYHIYIYHKLSLWIERGKTCSLRFINAPSMLGYTQFCAPPVRSTQVSTMACERKPPTNASPAPFMSTMVSGGTLSLRVLVLRSRLSNKSVTL